MMAETVSDFMLQRLYEWGIYRIYGYPGDGHRALTEWCIGARPG